MGYESTRASETFAFTPPSSSLLNIPNTLAVRSSYRNPRRVREMGTRHSAHLALEHEIIRLAHSAHNVCPHGTRNVRVGILS